MQTTTLSFANMHNHGELFANILRARRQSFIIQNRWELPEALGMEFDHLLMPFVCSPKVQFENSPVFRV